MRIVYVLTSLGMGGAERQVVALAERMAGRGHAVALMVLRPPVMEQWPTTVTVVHLGMRKTPGSVIAAMAHGRRFLAEFHPDLVHSHSFFANLAARLLKLFLPSLKVLSSVHNVYEGGWLRMLAYRMTDKLSCRTTTVSQAAGIRFVCKGAIPQHKCVIMPNGIDIEEFAPNAERREKMRVRMCAGKPFIWFTAGRIVPAKDYPNLLEAFAQVIEVRLDTQLWIAGELTGREASAVQALSEEFDLDRFVLWLGLRRDLPALLDAADGFVLASAWEGMPLAVGEAMAMEKPVVATGVGGVRELVGDAGVVVPPKAPDELAEAMIDMMRRKPQRRRAMGRAARERIVRDFSMDAKAVEWESLYRNLTVET